MRSEQGKRAKVQLGIDVLAQSGFAELAGLRIGLLANDASRNSAGAAASTCWPRHLASNSLRCSAPSTGSAPTARATSARAAMPPPASSIHSLYGKSRRPSDAMLKGLDAVVVDIQDVGARFYTYATSMAYVMEAAARRRIKVIVLDRPNPIAPAGVRGPMLDADLKSFVAYFPMPVQHAMTLGELAIMFNAENRIGADLHVVKMNGWRHDMWFDATDLAWVNPSPNLRNPDAAILYPGVALVEQTNVSVGRGTPTPFELVGAPWIDGPALARELESRRIPGVAFAPARFTPTSDKHAGTLCHGVHITLTDRAALDAPRLGLELAAALHRLHRHTFKVRDMLALLGSRRTLAAIEAGTDPSAIAQYWQPDLRTFEAMRARYLLY